MRSGRKAHRAGFTLIEMLAVVLILGLLAALALPNLGLRSGRSLDDEATRLAATLEYARQSAVLNRTPHRLVLDLDAGRYWLEWQMPESRGGDEAPPLGPPPETLEPREDAPVSLEAPRDRAGSFRPLPGERGAVRRLAGAVYAASVESPAGLVQGGRVEIVFERDGTSAPTELTLASDEGERLVLALRPLADTVGIRHAS